MNVLLFLSSFWLLLLGADFEVRVEGDFEKPAEVHLSKTTTNGARDLASITYPAVPGFGSVVEDFKTGADGEFWEIADQAGTRSLDWDSGRLVEVAYTGSSGPLAGYRLDYAYDKGRRN